MKSEYDIVVELNKNLPEATHIQGIVWSLWDSGYASSISFGNQCMWDAETSIVEHTEESDYYQDVHDYCIKQLAKYRAMITGALEAYGIYED